MKVGGEGKLRVASSPRICSSFLAVDVILAAIPWKPPVSFISSGAAALSVIENRWLKTIRDERASREGEDDGAREAFLSRMGCG